MQHGHSSIPWQLGRASHMVYNPARGAGIERRT